MSGLSDGRITMDEPLGIALVAGVGLVYLLIRLLPRLLAGRGALVSPRALHGAHGEAGGPVIVDVRSGAEFATGHLPGARNVPLAALDDGAGSGMDAETLAAWRRRGVVTVCCSDARAALATRRLRRRGVPARVLAGGIGAWQEEGLPLEQDAPAAGTRHPG